MGWGERNLIHIDTTYYNNPQLSSQKNVARKSIIIYEFRKFIKCAEKLTSSSNISRPYVRLVDQRWS